MKKVWSLILSAVFLMGPVGLVSAVDFTVSVSVPLATSVNMIVNSVNVQSNVWTPNSTSLSFTPMSFITANNANIWLPNKYFAIDVAATGGAGTPDVTVNYTEGVKPANQVHGLGWKSLATFVKIVGTTETPLTTHGPKKMLKDLVNEHILSTELTGVGAYLRIYLGIVTGNPAAAEPAGSEVFSNADRPGAYDGQLTITATVV